MRILTFVVLTLSSLLVSAQEFVPGEVIVKLKGKMASVNAKAFMSKAASEKGLALKGSWSSLNMHHYSVKPGQSVLQLINELKADPAVEYAEPNYVIKKSELPPGEPQQILSQQDIDAMGVSAMATASSTFSMTAAPIQAVEGWGAVSGSAVPVVAIIDTGMDMTHSALSNALWVNPLEVPNNNVDDDGNGYVDDVNGWNFADNNNYPQDCDGHGTHVAGIVRGVGQNLFQSPSPTAKIKIMPLKFLDCTGTGSTADAIKAIYYASNNGAQVVNNSWGGGSYSRSLQDAIVYSYQKKLLFVAAAGNSSTDNDHAPMYPAAYDVPNVLAVAATRDDDGIASFSNYGSRSVHAAAPGVGILSSYAGGGYTYLSGTSMAAPFMTGVAALMLIEKPSMPGYQLKSLILASVDPVSGLSHKVSTGGRLNSYRAVTAALSTSVDPSQPAYTSHLQAEDREIASNIATNGAGCGMVSKLDGSGPNIPPWTLPVLFAIPLVVWLTVRRRARGPSQRKFDRFVIDSSIKLKVGDQELIGSVGTISVGGAAINTNALLDQGSVITMMIESPDGKDRVQVQGKIVWSKSAQNYGIQFVDVESSVKATIQSWTRGLVKI